MRNPCPTVATFVPFLLEVCWAHCLVCESCIVSTACCRLEDCLEVLINTGRLPEAAFFARTYLPSQVSRYVLIPTSKVRYPGMFVYLPIQTGLQVCSYTYQYSQVMLWVWCCRVMLWVWCCECDAVEWCYECGAVEWCCECGAVEWLWMWCCRVTVSVVL